MLPGDNRSTVLLLQDLLDAQERIADEEFAFVNARVNYLLAIVELKRATGTLLEYGVQQPKQIEVYAPPIVRSEDNGPRLPPPDPPLPEKRQPK